MNKVTVKLVQQKNHYGVKPQVWNPEVMLTKSAGKWKVNLSELGFEIQIGKKPGQRIDKVDDSITTTSWSYDTTAQAAFMLLNEVDTRIKTPGYKEACDKYNEARKQVDNDLPPKELDGKGKLERYNRLKKYTFTYYVYQYYAIFEDENGTRKTVLSKKHFTLHPLQEKDIRSKLDKLQKITLIGNDAVSSSDTTSNIEEES